MIKSSSPRVAERLIEATEQRGENGKWPTDAETHYNVVLQIQTPSHAYRLIRMHGDPEIKSRMLPEVETVAEVANRPTGEGMVLLRGLSTPCIDFKRWLDSSLLRFNITRAYFVEGGCCATNEDDLMSLLEARGPPVGPVRLMCYPKSLERMLTTRLSPGWSLHPSSHTHTLFVVTISPSCYAFGLRPEQETFKTPYEAPARVPGQLSKAAGKLAEALVASGFRPRTGIALDVGAAPGGWTAQLAKRMNLVIAIDPAELHPDVQLLSNVIHIRKKTQDSMAEISAALDTSYADLLVCDANKHPLDVMKMLHPLFPMLRPGALFVLTLKFRGKGREKLGTENAMRSILGPGFGSVKLLHLFANTQWERMLVAVREEGPLGPGDWNGKPLFSGADSGSSRS